MNTPDLETFRDYAKDRRVIPVTRRLLADAETPIGVYGKLAAEREGTFLLESAENGGVWSRYSFIGVRSAATLTERDGEAVWTGNPPVGLPQTGDPLKALARDGRDPAQPSRLPDLPPAHRRHGRLPRVRRGPPAGEVAGHNDRRPRSARS